MKYELLRDMRDNSGIIHNRAECLTLVSTIQDTIRGTIVRCSFDRDGSVITFLPSEINSLIKEVGQ